MKEVGKFSKGPWMRNKRNGAFIEVHCEDDDDTPICTIHLRRIISGDRPNALANLALICAAPRLYDIASQLLKIQKGRRFQGGPEPMVAEELNFLMDELSTIVAKVDKSEVEEIRAP